MSYYSLSVLSSFHIITFLLREGKPVVLCFPRGLSLPEIGRLPLRKASSHKSAEEITEGRQRTDHPSDGDQASTDHFAGSSPNIANACVCQAAIVAETYRKNTPTGRSPTTCSALRSICSIYDLSLM